MSGLTFQQLRAMQFIEECVDEYDLAPSYAEIRDHLALASKSGVHRILRGLRERGFIAFPHHRARSITILKRVTQRPIPTEAELARMGGQDLGLLYSRIIYEMGRRGIETAIARADEITRARGSAVAES